MSERKIELVYFTGCPNAGRARESLGSILEPGSWEEWDLAAEGTPARLRRFGSPTVLVDGRDVTGREGGNAAVACRTDGAPSVDAIRAALAGLPPAPPRA